ncbi:MAG: alpha/beta hydrolase [Verrucomicrobiales bacterium]|nr:alpha/beta hydrolase [Verrucomicrobiales bacterium]
MRILFFFLLLAVTCRGSAEPLALDYAQRDEGALQLDLHLPESSPDKLHPVILWIHGGGWHRGSRNDIKIVSWLTEQDFALVSIDYRLTGVSPFPAQLEDCRAALAWIREHGAEHQLDPSRIVVAGLSAGAHLATLLAVSLPEGSPPVQGILHFFGPADFLQMARYARQPEDPLNQPESNLYQLLNGPLRERLELAKEASPVTHLDAGDPPCLILVGDKDTLMTQRQCERLHDAALEAGINASLHLIPGAGHGGKEFSDPERQTLILTFLQSILP